jgi:hypothetical protein
MQRSPASAQEHFARAAFLPIPVCPTVTCVSPAPPRAYGMRLTGILDWGDAGLSHPWFDLAVIGLFVLRSPHPRSVSAASGVYRDEGATPTTTENP